MTNQEYQDAFDNETYQGYVLMWRQALKEYLSNTDLLCYTSVVMAVRTLEKNNYSEESIEEAFGYLKIDADKIRSHDYSFYEFIREYA